MTDGLVTVSVGSRSYPGCKACASRFPAEVEEVLLVGYARLRP